MKLQVLVELAQERNEDIPALVYEARSSRRPPGNVATPQALRQHRQQPAEALGHGVPTSSSADINVASSLDTAVQGNGLLASACWHALEQPPCHAQHVC